MIEMVIQFLTKQQHSDLKIMTTTTKMTTTKPKVVKAKTTAIPNLPKIPFAFEVLDAASKQRTKAKKIEVLQRYAHDSIMALLIWNFDETAISVLPPGEVPYGNTREDNSVTGTLSDNEPVTLLSSLVLP